MRQIPVWAVPCGGDNFFSMPCSLCSCDISDWLFCSNLSHFFRRSVFSRDMSSILKKRHTTTLDMTPRSRDYFYGCFRHDTNVDTVFLFVVACPSLGKQLYSQVVSDQTRCCGGERWWRARRIIQCVRRFCGWLSVTITRLPAVLLCHRISIIAGLKTSMWLRPNWICDISVLCWASKTL